MKKNVASQVIGAQMVSATDGSAFTGTVSVDVTKDGGTKTPGGGSVVHEGGGFHTYTPTQAETNADHVGFSFSGTGAVPVTVQVYTTQFNFGVAGKVDANITHVNEIEVTGTGAPGTEWGPV